MKPLLFLAALAGCATDSPDRWSYIYETIVSPSCTTSACHSELAASGAVELHDRGIAFATLTGRACGEAAPPSGYVDVANPPASFLSVLLRRNGPTGMPPNNQLTADEIALIESWMTRGAPCD
jgi:hypothetical protein